ncbi:MAG: hypothetical protein IT576_19365 [Verrucomicrobiales bacterium]|nr:hypothetical protein [Verrucomicrobiales bacterium]
MKREGGLFDRVCDARRIVEAAWRASQGKRHRPEVVAFMARLEAEAARMVADLSTGTYTFSRYGQFQIRDPKTRVIHAPAFRDRVLHHALIGVTGPSFELGAMDQSFACRAGKGQHAALRQARSWLRPKDWFLKLDVAKFYDSIPHERMRWALRRRFRERRLLALFDRLLDSYHHSPGHGLPIGALTSQYLGNFYLDVFDRWVKQTCRVARYLRYMDDMLLVADPETLRAVRTGAAEALGEMGLRMKGGGVMNRAEHGAPFLGFVLYPDRTRLNRLGRRRLRRRLHGIEKEHCHGKSTEADLQSRATALFAHAQFGDDIAWRRMVCGFSRLGEALEPDDGPRPARRLLEQYRQELPLRHPQQEQGGQSQQEQRLPSLFAPWHGDTALPPDDAPSRAPATAGDETTRKTPPQAEICPGRVEKACGGAAKGEDNP